MGSSKQEKWLVLQAAAKGDVVVTGGELAMAREAVAKVPMLPFQGRHQRWGLQGVRRPYIHHWLREQ